MSGSDRASSKGYIVRWVEAPQGNRETIGVRLYEMPIRENYNLKSKKILDNVL